MMRVMIDEAAIEAAGLTLLREGNEGILVWTPEEDERSETVARVMLEGDEMVLFPRRSAGQRELLQILGIAA